MNGYIVFIILLLCIWGLSGMSRFTVSIYGVGLRCRFGLAVEDGCAGIRVRQFVPAVGFELRVPLQRFDRELDLPPRLALGERQAHGIQDRPVQQGTSVPLNFRGLIGWRASSSAFMASACLAASWGVSTRA